MFRSAHVCIIPEGSYGWGSVGSVEAFTRHSSDMRPSRTFMALKFSPDVHFVTRKKWSIESRPDDACHQKGFEVGLSPFLTAPRPQSQWKESFVHNLSRDKSCVDQFSIFHIDLSHGRVLLPGTITRRCGYGRAVRIGGTRKQQEAWDLKHFSGTVAR